MTCFRASDAARSEDRGDLTEEKSAEARVRSITDHAAMSFARLEMGCSGNSGQKSRKKKKLPCDF